MECDLQIDATTGAMYCARCGASGEAVGGQCQSAQTTAPADDRKPEGVRTWFTPDGPISEWIYPDDGQLPPLNTDTINAAISSINPAEIKADIMALGAAHGYEHMVAHTLTVIGDRLNAWVREPEPSTPDRSG